MATYQTHQRKILLDFLNEHPHNGFTAKQLALQLAEHNISQSAVYRNLKDLEQNGFVRRYTKSGSQESHYQYTKAPQCHSFLHITCLHCGNTVHAPRDVLEQFSQCVLSESGFMVDAEQSVFYGRCRQCTQVHPTP